MLDSIVQVKNEIALIANRHNFIYIEDNTVLENDAAGHTTELDGVQATVFEVLFGEII